MQFPAHSCVLCEARCQSVDLCPGCEADLPWISDCCPICALPGRDAACSRCEQYPPPFSLATAPLQYRFPVDAMLSRFKHARRLADGQVLAGITAAHAARTFSTIASDSTIVVPVPLHWRRQRQRGFNQAALLAGCIARRMSWPVSLSICRRSASGPDMKRLPADQRARAIRNVFTVSRVPAGQRILLVDDVITTCATVTELTRQLLTMGAEDVVVIAAARTPAVPQTSALC